MWVFLCTTKQKGKTMSDDLEYIETPELVTYAEGFMFVNVYELDLSYGGPEEGGWWVTCGTLIRSHQVPAGDVERVVAELEAEYPDANTARRERALLPSVDENGDYIRQPRIYCYTDVNYHGGDYQVLVEDKPGADFPEVFPHYE